MKVPRLKRYLDLVASHRNLQLSVLPVLLACWLVGCAAGHDGVESVGESRSHIYDSEYAGFAIFAADDKRNDPRASSPDYVYLLLGKEAAALTGPVLTGPGDADYADLFEFRSPFVEVRMETLPEGQHAIGLDVVINERLTYRFDIDDFEDEGSVIGTATLTLDEGTLQSEFVFAATGSPGIAHDLTIQARVDGVATGAPTSPIAIETRHDADACIIGADWVDEILEPRRTCVPGDVCIVLTAPGDCWHGTVNEADQDMIETIELEVECPENCSLPVPSGAECQDGKCQLLP